MNIFYSFKGFRGTVIYGNILTSDNILSIPSVNVIVHISSVIAIVVVSSVVHHVRPGIPSNSINQVPNPSL